MKVEWISFYFFVLAGFIQLFQGFFELGYLKHVMFLRLYNLDNKITDLDKNKFFKFRFIIHIFLVLMLIVGLKYIFQGQVRMAGVVTGFAGLGMILSGLGLFLCYRESWKAALIEVLPVIFGFFFLIFHIIR